MIADIESSNQKPNECGQPVNSQKKKKYPKLNIADEPGQRAEPETHRSITAIYT